MLVPDESFDPETLAMMSSVLSEAWADVQAALNATPVDPESLRSMLASRIVDAVREGERDPVRLKHIAIRAIDG